MYICFTFYPISLGVVYFRTVYIKKLIPRCDLQRGISLSLLFEQWMFARLANKEHL